MTNHNEKLNAILEIIETLQIYIQNDGGEFEFVDYKDDVVTIRLKGACVGCSMTDVTYENGLQELLRDEVDPNISVNIII